jgi:MFS family permease
VVLASTLPAVGWLVPLWALGGAFNGGVNVAAAVLMARRVPAPVRGRASAVFGAVANGANGTGYVLGGVLLSVVSARMLLGLAGGVGLLVALAFAVPLLRAAAHDHAGVPATAPTPAPVAVS